MAYCRFGYKWNKLNKTETSKRNKTLKEFNIYSFFMKVLIKYVNGFSTCKTNDLIENTILWYQDFIIFLCDNDDLCAF